MGDARQWEVGEKGVLVALHALGGEAKLLRRLHHAVGVGAHFVRPGDLTDAGDGQLQAVLPGNGGQTRRGAVRDVVLFDTGVFHLFEP